MLPKLNPSQVGVIRRRLERVGLRVAPGFPMSAASGTARVRVDPAGVCWSSTDTTDLIAPCIPELLGTAKEAATLPQLADMYFKVRRSGLTATVRLSTRAEASRWWRLLRSSDQAALTPDEREVASFILGHARGSCSMVTDFPNDSSVVRVIGERQYYETVLSRREASTTLREAGRRSSRNSYLPSDCLLRFDRFPAVGRSELRSSFAKLGDWCGFVLQG